MDIMSQVARSLRITGCLAIALAVTVRESFAAETPTLRTIDPSDELFAGKAVPGIQITIPETGVAVLREYNWRQSSATNPREDVRATVREGNTVYTNVAVHLKGSAGSFRPIDSEKPALTLNFDKFAKGQRFHGLQKLHLNNSVQDPSYISEIICREIFMKAGIPSPRASHVLVDLNGHGAQLYVLVEGWNKQLLKRHFKNPSGNLYAGGFAEDINKPIEVQSGENPEDRTRLDDLFSATLESNLAVRSKRLADVLDTDRFLTFLAMELLTVHWDGYGMNRNNYRIFHDMESDRMVFLPHGMDQMFGMWRSKPQSPITPMMKGVVAKAVMSDPALRRRYLDRMSSLLTNVLDYAAISNRAGELTRRIQPHLLKNFIELANQDRYSSQFCDRVAQRIESAREQLTEASTPVRFDTSGVAHLSRWRNSTESGSPGFARNQNGDDTLQITANGSQSYGSWRTQVLLNDGQYHLTGRVKTENLSTNRTTRGGVSLRISGDREPKMLVNAPDWTTLQYDFEVNGLLDMELVCEFRASQGSVQFDASSLKLIRKGDREKK